MYISLRNDGFNKSSKDHRSSNDNDDDTTGGATPIAMREASSDGEGPEEAAHRPWRIPGVGGSF